MFSRLLTNARVGHGRARVDRGKQTIVLSCWRCLPSSAEAPHHDRHRHTVVEEAQSIFVLHVVVVKAPST